MKASCVVALALLFAGLGAVRAVALDTPTTVASHKKVAHKTRHTATAHPAHRAVRARTTPAKAKARTATRTAARTRTTRRAKVAVSTSSRATVRRTVVRRTVIRRHRYYERFTANPFLSGEVGQGDITAGEDPVVRQAAIDALGDLNGTAVVINPSNGRILAMVNQKLALSPGAEPCSTIKLSVALAALSEGLVTRDTMVKLPGFRMNMTQALAHSNNLYFEELGRELGFERVHHYATEFGLGELAGYHIQGEQLGTYPDHAIPEAQGGVGRMCSFGQGVSMTPLQLGAIVTAIANGGTLYYLQHPTNPEELANFKPMIKRKLDIARYIPDVEDGMAGAVEYGTARSLRVNFHELPVFGKTGTCSDNGTRFGWFASFSTSPQGNLVTVFFFEGRRGTSGPHTAEITGQFYRSLWDHDYFNTKMQQAQDAPVQMTPVSANSGAGATQ
jgi:penicillin-binding protein 2